MADQAHEYTEDNPPPCPGCGRPCTIADDADWIPTDDQGNEIDPTSIPYTELEALWLADDAAWLWGCEFCGVDYPGRWPVPHYTEDEE